jgi:hypothetical protein
MHDCTCPRHTRPWPLHVYVAPAAAPSSSHNSELLVAAAAMQPRPLALDLGQLGGVAAAERQRVDVQLLGELHALRGGGGHTAAALATDGHGTNFWLV